jgi:hypothetical protein
MATFLDGECKKSWRAAVLEPGHVADFSSSISAKDLPLAIALINV